MDIVTYAKTLTPAGWILISVFFLIVVLALYSQFRKRRSTEK
ncbi:MAG TPA: hypothetical protein VK154_06340 [Chitinophagales bacterium]|nr:hypothetical protein [Chitinophagales bacterium]